MSAPAARVRTAEAADIEAVTALDTATSGEPKPGYWQEIHARAGRGPERLFLVAELDGRVVGFIVGEIRAWEFGSPPCGWVFALNVDPGVREGGIGAALFDAMCDRFRSAGIGTVRTMVNRRQRVQLSFFRSQGLKSGPYIELEKPLD